GLFDSIIFGMNYHSIADLAVAGRLKFTGTFDIYQAHSAVCRDRQGWVVAEVRHFVAGFGSSAQNGRSFVDLNLGAVDRNFWHCVLLLSLIERLCYWSKSTHE